jgi:O-antigen/teichoic acid export membrane protein
MNWIFGIIGLLLILLGAGIWRFKLINLLSNVDKKRVIDQDKATKVAGYYLILLGICFFTFGYIAHNMNDKTILLIIACFIPANMVVVVLYMVVQSRNVKVK